MQNREDGKDVCRHVKTVDHEKRCAWNPRFMKAVILVALTDARVCSERFMHEGVKSCERPFRRCNTESVETKQDTLI